MTFRALGVSLRISVLEQALQTTHTHTFTVQWVPGKGGRILFQDLGARPGPHPPKCPNLLHVRRYPQNTACGAKRLLRRWHTGQLPHGGQSCETRTPAQLGPSSSAEVRLSDPCLPRLLPPLSWSRDQPVRDAGCCSQNSGPHSAPTPGSGPAAQAEEPRAVE